MFVTLALINMKETEALSGLYVWCKNVTGRKFPWVRCAAEQTAKKYELAIDGYRKILEYIKPKNDEDEPELVLEPDIHQFVYDQIVTCYKEMGNWVELMNLSTGENFDGVGSNGRRYWFSIHDWKSVYNMFNVEAGHQAFTELSSWDYKDEPETWSQYHEQTCDETNLYGVAFTVDSLQSGFAVS